MAHLNILIGVAVAVFFIASQFQARRLTARALLIVPLVLAYFGLPGVEHLSSLDTIGFFALNVVLALGFGLWRGFSFRVWRDGGPAWRQGTAFTLALWGASIAARLILLAAGHLVGLSGGAAMADLPFIFAITLGAQNLVIWLRAYPAAFAFAS
ncbi:MAG: hypothetical protein M3Z66_12545 [Chloroflexota bacterium]|nr:hypothetical protein [Chloroflexota bacterium]